MNLAIFLEGGGIYSSYNLLIAASAILILSFFFIILSNKTNVPSVLMLIVLGVAINFGLGDNADPNSLFPYLELLGTVGLIMIVLEAALDLKLEREKTIPIIMAFVIALIGLLASAAVATAVLKWLIPDITLMQALFYATPLSILSSAIIIPSVISLRNDKKEFHIYESTFSDILGIMMFYFLKELVKEDAGSSAEAAFGFASGFLITIVISLIAGYFIIYIFQNIKSHVKLFVLIAILLLLYAIGKKAGGAASLIIILIFGLMIANMELFFAGKLRKHLNLKKAMHIYEELHIITLETAFVVRTFFFVIFGMTILLSELFDVNVAMISLLIIASIYIIRYLMLRVAIGKDIIPQIYIAPRGLITVLLFYQIPKSIEFADFNKGILLFIIIGTSVIMTIAMIYDKRRAGSAVETANATPVGYVKYKPPSIDG